VISGLKHLKIPDKGEADSSARNLPSSIRIERSEIRFTGREHGERPGFFAHVFAPSGSRSERSERGNPRPKKVVVDSPEIRYAVSKNPFNIGAFRRFVLFFR